MIVVTQTHTYTQCSGQLAQLTAEISRVRFPGGLEMNGQSPFIHAPVQFTVSVSCRLCPTSRLCGCDVRFQPYPRNPSTCSPKLMRGGYWLAYVSPAHDQTMVNDTHTHFLDAVNNALLAQANIGLADHQSVPHEQVGLGVVYEVPGSHFNELKKAPLRRVLAGDCESSMPSVHK